MSQNPLLNNKNLPLFSQINPEHITPAIKQIINDNEKSVDYLLNNTPHFTWCSLQEKLDNLEDKLQKAWSAINHMNSVVNSEELQNAYNNCLPLLSNHSTKMGQNQKLYDAYCQLAQSAEFQTLNAAQKKVIENSLRDFRLSGIALSEEKKSRYGEIKKELSKLSSQFSNNLLNATMAWSKLITDKQLLSGIPESSLNLARQLAQSKGHEQGWMFNLDAPSYFAVMTYSDNQDLRQEIYTEYTTKASDQNKNSIPFDNTVIIDRILSLRHELAQILGFKNYAEYSLDTKMASSPKKVIEFLSNLAKKSKTQAQHEMAELLEFVQDKFSMEHLNAWDIAYYSEKLRQKTYAISQEEIRPWFPVNTVLEGMFSIVNKLFDISIKEIKGIETWHPDVRFFNIEKNENIVGRFYLDLYAREHKQNGAWMDCCQSRRKDSDGNIQIPVAYLTCNFTPPINNKPVLLTHDEVITLFHEFGHGLHHTLTTVDYLTVSGINSVPWDAVELPSQLLENWGWSKKSIALISGHIETQEPLPDHMFDKLLAAKNFQSAMAMMRQLEFALFDFNLHKNYTSNMCVQDILDSVRKEVSVINTPKFNRFQNSFSHIFDGGYDAGYYSYKWAEVLSADAFSRFEEEGILNPKTGSSFLKEILQQGGSFDPMELFVKFKGREPKVDALLQQSDINYMEEQ